MSSFFKKGNTCLQLNSFTRLFPLENIKKVEWWEREKLKLLCDAATKKVSADLFRIAHIEARKPLYFGLLPPKLTIFAYRLPWGEDRTVGQVVLFSQRQFSRARLNLELTAVNSPSFCKRWNITWKEKAKHKVFLCVWWYYEFNNVKCVWGCIKTGRRQKMNTAVL